MNKPLHPDKLEDVCAIMCSTYEIPVYYIDAARKVVFASLPPGASTAAAPERLSELTTDGSPASLPIIHTARTLENYIEVRLEDEGEYAGSLIAGPSIYSVIPEDTLDGIAKDWMVRDKEALRQRYGRLPVIPQKRLLQASALLYYLVYGRRIDIVDVLLANRSIETLFRMGENVDLEVSDRLNNSSLHHDWLYERQLMQLVKEGKPDQLAQEMTLGIKTEGMGTLSKRSHLRSLKNLSVAGISIATRAAMEGGLHPEIAYTMSDLYIQQIEELQDPDEVDKATKQALIEFAERVGKSSEEQVSSAVEECKRYIFNHLYGELSLETLAGLVHMNPSYLSRLFKKETGKPLTDYIQWKRVEEAKKLLTLTASSLSDIYSRLNFNDQSYFTKVFKKYAGVTPKQYRNGLRSEKDRADEHEAAGKPLS